MKKALSLFSYVLHPVFIPVFAVFFYFFLNENYLSTQQKYLIIAQVTIITVLIPISFFYLLKTLGKVDSVMVSEVSQRKIPLFIQLILIYILISKSITVDRIPELYYFFLGGLFSTMLAFLLTYLKVKASLHMMGISTLTAFVIGLSFHNQANVIFPIAFLFLLNGLVATSRLEMKAHSGKELVIGFFTGLLPQLGLLYFWL